MNLHSSTAHQFHKENATNSTQLKNLDNQMTQITTYAGQNKIKQPDDQMNSKPYKIQKGQSENGCIPSVFAQRIRNQR